MIKKILILFIFLFLLAEPKNIAMAGFGVSPPYIKSDILRPGTEYEQKLFLLRSAADDELEARVTIEAPAIESWLTIDEGLSFKMAKGELRVPMTVKVNIPLDADLGSYKGKINISAAPVKNRTSGIAISEGALVEVDLTLTNKIFSDFKIRQVKIPDYKIPGKFWNNKLFNWFFRPLKLIARIENTGNIETAPSKITLDVYGIPAKSRLDSMLTEKINKIKPYQTQETIISFPSKLAIGQYWGRVRVYKENEILYNEQVAFTVSPSATIVDIWSGFKIWQRIIIIVIGFLILFSLLVFFRFRDKWRTSNFLSDLLKNWRNVKRRIMSIWLEAKFKFLRWLRNKSISVTANKNRTKNKSTKKE